MGFRKFSVLLAARWTLIMLTLVGLSRLISLPGYHAATALVGGILVFLGFETFQFVTRTNAELRRFLDAARYADFSQRFQMRDMGAGFGELGEAFSDILHKFQDARSNQEIEVRYLKALIEHIPVPLFSVRSDDTVHLWNNAARRLIGNTPVARLPDLKQFGETVTKDITDIKPGERKLLSFQSDTIEHQMMLASTQITLDGRVEKLISLQDIQSELDLAQLQAWQDLVRVLTHEIMNSITPIASLARTAVDIVDDAAKKVTNNPEVIAELSDVKDAVNTVARRSDKLNQFVSSYHSLTRLPSPTIKRFSVRELLDQMDALVSANWQEKGITITKELAPETLELNADRDMVEQIIINLLKNAEQVLANTENAEVLLSARLTKRGRIILEVLDNGPGVEPEIAKKIFVPFFTTKREGSGVGLALTRQVMIAHGGAVSVSNSKTGGARFTLTF
jgi:nitrogen fixation/metabolism regulation signal transduction histidine kinase